MASTSPTEVLMDSTTSSPRRRDTAAIASTLAAAAASAHLNLNNHGQVVGFYPDDQGVIRSFVKDRRGRVTTFAVPDAAATLAAGINDRGQIVIPDLGTGLTPATSPQPTATPMGQMA